MLAFAYGDHLKTCHHYLATRTQGRDHIQACVVSLFREAGYTATTKHVPRIPRAQDQCYVADLYVYRMAWIRYLE